MIRTFTSDEIRDTFLEFFVKKNHTRIDSASIVPVNDPSLLFVNAGMAPLKRYFLGEAIPPAADLCNVQPCVRTNDITDVGDRHHLTFFEMLGSWSIDNYFKERAVELAFELLTERFGFPKDKLYVTVYRGNAELGLPPDDVSAAAWERVGMARDHIVYLGEDNFWSTGDTGPCGPCTEVFYDTGSEHGETYRPGGEFDTTSRYIEIWNAGVFMEFDKRPDGRFERLRFPSVDTGSGLERMAMVLQGHDSAYETDLLAPVVRAVREGLGGAAASERDVRIISDHIRSSTFMLSEGVAPSNEGRGYIPRRLLRKTIAVATRSGFQDIDVPELADVVIDRLKGAYPRLGTNRDRTLELLAREQRDFGRVVRRGLDQLSGLATGPGFRISGEEAFNLYATHGMPVDLIRDFATEQGGSVDDARFTELFSEHRELSRGGTGKAEPGAAKPAARTLAPEVVAAIGAAGTEFLGYEELEASARVLSVSGPDGPADSLATGEEGLVVLDRSPCYPEGGGQVGDTGRITGTDLTAEVTDTRRIDGHHVHFVRVDNGVLRTGDTLRVSVDADRRRATMRNHSATHLLHAVLREVLGEQVRQAGSLVAPDRLRFDFEHPQALTEDETDRVERLVNARVLANAGRNVQVKPYQEAVRDGAIAFFGDKYGDDVRVVSFAGVSSELCGGTHVSTTAEIGLFRIVGEGSVGAGVRRIEAVTGEGALAYTLDRDRTLKQVSGRLRVSAEQLPARIEALTAKEQKPARQARISAESLAGEVRESVSGLRHVVVVDPPLDPKQLADEAARLGDELGAVVLFLVPDGTGSSRIGVGVPAALSARGTAKDLLERVLAVTGGRGGGSARFAQGGGITAPLAEVAAAAGSVLEGASV
ncbi:alanine--tRNA ligase [Streptomyces sp. NPDC057939]|uniref:alanine--tRNA ligase n=1 Tax=Streptomyces sp. NPDC057939 TaxID=3346284 RepID=UPI0036E74DCC